MRNSTEYYSRKVGKILTTRRSSWRAMAGVFLLLVVTLAPLSAQVDRRMKPQNEETPAANERRLAFVMGISAYQHTVPLRNPANDADDMEAALSKVGFTVTKITNKTLGQSTAALNTFVAGLRPGDVVLFFYAGHGIGYLGDNYLLPTDARVECLEQIPAYTLSANRILADFQSKRVKNSFIFLDACRNLGELYACRPDQRDAVEHQGLVIPKGQQEGDVIVYATQAGRTASDNAASRNGLFTQELLKYLTVPNLTLYEIVRNTITDVLTASKQRGLYQLPVMYGGLALDFMFLQQKQPDPMETQRKLNEALQAEIARLKAEKANTPPEPSKPTTDLEPVAMRYVAGGSFDMGSNDGGTSEKPVHRVTVSSFRMATYETTVAEFERFVDATGYRTDAEKEEGSYVITTTGTYEKKAGVNWRFDAFGKSRPRSEYTHPVIHVSYNDAVAYCAWLTKTTGMTYRLPTEAEWEYAARGGNQSQGTTYAGSNDLNKVGWYTENTKDSGTRVVGQKLANELGLFDMSGNVWEWCSDWYGADYYASSAATNPTGPSSGSYRVLRGGSWNYSPQISRVAHRNYITPSYRHAEVGFRVVAPQ